MIVLVLIKMQKKKIVKTLFKQPNKLLLLPDYDDDNRAANVCLIFLF